MKKLFSYKSSDKYKRVLTIFGIDFAWTNTRELRKSFYNAERQLIGLNVLLQYLYDITQMPKARGKLRELQNLRAIGLEIFAKIAQKHNYKYWLEYGSLLGSVRHKGFIPWDDDIDVAMLRDEYIEIYKTMQKELAKYPDLKFAPVKEGIIISRLMYKDIILVDVFPYDYYFSNEITDKEEKQINAKNRKCFRICKKHWGKEQADNKNVLYFWNIIKENMQKLVLSDKEPKKDMIFCGCEAIGYRTYFFNTRDIFPLQKMAFEDFSFYVPKDYDSHLKKIYGDYMSLPDLNTFAVNHYDTVNLEDCEQYSGDKIKNYTEELKDILNDIYKSCPVQEEELISSGS